MTIVTIEPRCVEPVAVAVHHANRIDSMETNLPIDIRTDIVAAEHAGRVADGDRFDTFGIGPGIDSGIADAFVMFACWCIERDIDCWCRYHSPS